MVTTRRGSEEIFTGALVMRGWILHMDPLTPIDRATRGILPSFLNGSTMN